VVPRFDAERGKKDGKHDRSAATILTHSEAGLAPAAMKASQSSPRCSHVMYIRMFAEGMLYGARNAPHMIITTHV
jgi:hypothetical protein